MAIPTNQSPAVNPPEAAPIADVRPPETPRVGRRLRIAALAAVTAAAFVSLAMPKCLAHEVCDELLRGAGGGLVIGLVVTGFRLALAS